ncbi:MAG: polysaccharide deacetylase family protein [Nitrospira defluvii]|nr:polysaccharide deacetylase family protein [Nitrospira defluvii]
MKLVVTVDVEEDQWGITPPRYATVHNVRRLPILQKLFSEFGIIPTYLLTYPVVSDPHAVAILREIMEGGGCEIGAHCHPWNTPPYEESLNKHSSMLCNLPATLQFEKLQRLHEAIQNSFAMTPIAFRSGRWGFDTEVARNIVRLGYRIDTSITPYTSWAQESGPDFSYVSPQPYMYRQESATDGNLKGGLAEIPVTIGYLHGEFQVCARLAQRLRSGPFRGLRLGGFLSRLHVLRKVWLSPEMETPARMIQLVRQMRNQGYEILNLVFHSSALMGGCGPFIRTEADEQLFLERLVTLLRLARKEAVEFALLSEAARLSPTGLVESKAMRASLCVTNTCRAGSAYRWR